MVRGLLGGVGTARSRLRSPAAGHVGNRAVNRRPFRKHDLHAGMLGLARISLLLATWLLGWIPSGVGVVAGALHLDAQRLHLCRGILGLPIGAARPVIRAVPFWGRVLFSTWSLHPLVRDSAGLSDRALFVRPAWRCYYFGDFFEERYARRGLIPWIDYRIGRRVYDANYAYYIHRFGRDETWQKNLRDLYVGRRQGTIERPPHTLVEQFKAVDKFRGNRMAEANVTAGLKITHSQNVSVLAPISRIHNVQVTNMASLAKVDNHAIATEHHVVKIAEVSKEQRAGEIKSHVDQVKKVQERRMWKRRKSSEIRLAKM